jgi:uncharacterized membrane protein YphA (DoxX/SURF4 family)
VSAIKPVRLVSRAALAAVWLYEGLVPKLLFIREDQLDLVQRSGLIVGNPQLTLQLLGTAQIAFAVWLLSGFAERLAALVATAGMAVLIALVARGNPAMLTDPYGALVKDLCLTACAFTIWSLAPAAPD